MPLPDSFASKFENIISKFIWRGHLTNNVLSRDTICLPKERGGLGVPHLRLKCKSLFLKQMFRAITGQGQSRDHYDFWLGKRMNIPFLPSYLHHIRGVRGSEKDITPPFFTYSLKLINEVFNDNIITPNEIFSVTAKQLYNAFSESLPSAKIEETYPEHDWPRTWKLLSNKVLSSESVSFMYLITHERVGTRERGHRLMPNKYPTSNCPRCTRSDESIKHCYIECSFVSDVWAWIYSKIIHLDPFLGEHDDLCLLQLKFSSSIHDNAIIWLLGNFISLVEREVVSKNNILSLPFVIGFFRQLKTSHSTQALPDISFIPGIDWDNEGIG